MLYTSIFWTKVGCSCSLRVLRLCFGIFLLISLSTSDISCNNLIYNKITNKPGQLKYSKKKARSVENEENGHNCGDYLCHADVLPVWRAILGYFEPKY